MISLPNRESSSHWLDTIITSVKYSNHLTSDNNQALSKVVASHITSDDEWIYITSSGHLQQFWNYMKKSQKWLAEVIIEVSSTIGKKNEDK